MGGASTAAPLDARGTLYWNPAAISGLPSSELDLGLELLNPRSTISSSIPGGALGPGFPPASISGGDSRDIAPESVRPFVDNAASDESGLIDNWAGGTAIVNDDTFTGNSTPCGGGIDNEWGTVTVPNSIFNGNSAIGDGGAIATFNPNDIEDFSIILTRNI